MKNHLKRIAAPKSWILDRKIRTFTIRPNPGAHSLETGLPLGLVIRDMLNLTSSMAETRKLMYNNEVLVDGRRRKDSRHPVGLFDVISIPLLKKHYRILLDEKGRLGPSEVSASESSIKLGKIVGKRAVAKGKIQFCLYDGKNIISEKEARVGDTFLLALPSLEIKEVIPLQPGVAVFLTKGKHSGDLGVLKELRGDEAVYTLDKKNIETSKSYLFAVGKGEPAITIKIRESIKEKGREAKEKGKTEKKELKKAEREKKEEDAKKTESKKKEESRQS